VAIPSYRTYPDGKAIDQVHDAEAALSFLQHKFPQHCQHVTLMGHSSGAHIGLLLLAERVKQRFEQGQLGVPANNNLLTINAFVGLSGPYDISHHFDYEAARGVEELSPMKAACGMTREGFRLVSPALCVLDSLSTLSSEHNVAQSLPSHMLLLHAIEDETVPFTSTAEAARVLRSCGVQQCQEYYVGPGTSHQDTVMQLMVGGPSCDAVLSWLEQVVASEKMVVAPPTMIKTSSKL
jgi:acetyl esterase/lipase